MNAFHEHDPALSRTRPKRVARAGYLTNARWSRSGSSECFARIVPDLCMYVCPVEYIAALGFPAVESSRAWPAHRPREDGLTHPADTSKDPILLLPWLCSRLSKPFQPGGEQQTTYHQNDSSAMIHVCRRGLPRVRVQARCEHSMPLMGVSSVSTATAVGHQHHYHQHPRKSRSRPHDRHGTCPRDGMGVCWP